MAVSIGDRTGTRAPGLDGLAADGAFTWDDLQTMPEDRFRWELVDGQLLVTPSPAGRHQGVVGELYLLLRLACPGDLRVMLSPYDWKLSAHTVFVPDLMVIRQADFDPGGPFTGVPLLVVEVRSPSTAATDRTLKRQQYEQHGVPAYWLVDPGGPAGGHQRPSLTVLRLRDGGLRRGGRRRGRPGVRRRLPVPRHRRPGPIGGRRGRRLRYA